MRDIQSELKKMEDLKAQIKALDNLLDELYDTEPFDETRVDSIEQVIRDLTAELGAYEQKWLMGRCKEIKPNEWLKNFLESFGDKPTSRTITAGQYHIFAKVNENQPFKYNGMRYAVSVIKGSGKYAHLFMNEVI